MGVPKSVLHLFNVNKPNLTDIYIFCYCLIATTEISVNELDIYMNYKRTALCISTIETHHCNLRARKIVEIFQKCMKF